MKNATKQYTKNIRELVGEQEYARYTDLVKVLARNLAVEDKLWNDILTCANDYEMRNDIIRLRMQVLKDIHAEFKILNIEIPTLAERTTVDFMSDMGELDG